MAQKVDELQLQISSDASSAIASLENLARNLESASASAKSFVNSANSLKALANGLNKIAGVNFNSAISGLTRLSKIDLSNLKDKKVDITLSVSGADQAERLVYATQDAEKNVLKSASRISKAFGQKYNVDSEGISEMTVQVKELISALANENGGSANEAIGNIFNIITQRGRMSLAELQGVKNDYIKEYNELKKIVVGTSNLSATEIESLFGQGFGANLKKGAESSDMIWAEIVEEHKDVFEKLGVSAASVGDQVKALADRLEETAEYKGISLDAPSEVISEDGSAVFSNLESGLYLIVQTHRGTDSLRYQIEPFLVSIPVRQGNGSLSYNPALTYKSGTGELGTAEIELRGATMVDNAQLEVKKKSGNTKWIILAAGIAVAAVAVLVASRRATVE